MSGRFSLLGLRFPAVLRELFLHDLLTVVLDVLPVPHIFVHLLFEVVLIVIRITLLVSQLDAHVGLRHAQELLFVLTIVNLAFLLHVTHLGHQLADLQAILLQHILDGVVVHLNWWLVAELHATKLLAKMTNA